jgi:hypothetical protein
MAPRESAGTAMTKNLLTLMAVLEAATGIALLAWPAVAISLLLGAAIDDPGQVALARVTGAGMLALGIACWFARDDGRSRPGRGVITAMLAYNVVVVAILVYGALILGLSGVGLWPAAGSHSALAVWCVASLRQSPP